MSAPQHSARPGPQSNFQTQLLSRALVGVVLPVMLVGGVAWWVLSGFLDRVETDFASTCGAIMEGVAGGELLGQARSAARQIDSFFLGHMGEAVAWAKAPVIVGAARAAHERHVAEGLTEADVATIEDRFRDVKSLGTSPEAETYLRRTVSASPYFAEIFFTDANGFNVALTNPTSDFIQSDERWWQDAWSQGIAIGEFEYDDSAGTWSIAISVRLEDPSTSEPVGVMKLVLAIEPVQRIAGRIAEALPGGHARIATKDGVLIAEAASGHDGARTANRDVAPAERDELGLLSAEGFAVQEDWLQGHARTGGADTYAPVAPRFSGFEWVVVVRQPAAVIHNRIPALGAIDDTLRGWRRILEIGTVALVLLWAVVAVAVAVRVARRYSKATEAAREFVESVAQGRPAALAEIDRPREIARLYDAVGELTRAYLSTSRSPGAGAAREVSGRPGFPRSRE